LDRFEEGERLWKVTRKCAVGITMNAVMKKIHYVLRLLRMQANHAGSWQRHYVGAGCMVSTRKGPNHAKDVLFTYISMYYFPDHPQKSNPFTKIQDGRRQHKKKGFPLFKIFWQLARDAYFPVELRTGISGAKRFLLQAERLRQHYESRPPA
jgi:hypothetical protein